MTPATHAEAPAEPVVVRAGAVRLKAAYLMAGAGDWIRQTPGLGRGKLLEEQLRRDLSDLGLSLTAIDDHMKRLDRRFHGFGEDMTQLTEASHRLVEQCTALLELSIGSGDTHTLAQTTLEMLEEPLRFLTGQGESMTACEEQMESCRAAIQEVLCADSRLSEAVAPLRYIRTMFRTEAARLDESIQAMFNALTDQMRALQERVEGAFESNYSSLRETQETLARVSRTLRERSQLLSQGGAASGVSVARSREALIESLRRNEGKTVELTEVARGIETFVQNMVISMQVHDIVNQKLQHVREAITNLREQSNRLSASRPGDTGSLLASLHQLARIQEAQLEGAAADLRQSASDFGSSCSQVVTKIEELDQQCLQLKEFDEITASADGMIEVLVHSIGEVRRLAGEERGVITGILERVKWMGELAAPLGSGMVEVAEQMRRIAVNTQVYAIQMGNGTGLEALSAESVQVAARVANVSSDVVAALGRLNALLVEITAALEERYEAASRIESVMNQQGTELETSLHATRDRMIGMLLEIGDSMERARNIGSSVQNHIQAEDLFSGGITKALHAVRSFEGTCGWLLQQLGMAGVEADNSRLLDRYTMISERQIHARITGADASASHAAARPRAHSAGPPAAQPAAPPAAAPEDDLGDNVELF